MGYQAEELPQGVAERQPLGGRGVGATVPEAGELQGGSMRGAVATAVSLADLRMYSSSDRAEACRSACKTSGRGTPA